ncbi:hypothetical protein AHiyo1_04440 [Arthrobacter sp. Hiyo1]|nr:hypothetical protein AHiyo1_04440 [Arthrobacter sp. Hiyo1]
MAGPAATPPEDESKVKREAHSGRDGSNSRKAAELAPVARPTAIPWSMRPAESIKRLSALAKTKPPTKPTRTASTSAARLPIWSDQWPASISTATSART